MKGVPSVTVLFRNRSGSRPFPASAIGLSRRFPPAGPMHLVLTVLLLIAAPASAREYHVGADHPLKTVSAAAELAQPGDTIWVHEGVYREEINPPRGGLSEDQRIVYTAAPGEKVVIKGSEPVTGWTHVQHDTWKITLPNRFFGAFNPYADEIKGDWFNGKGRKHHTGAVYVDGHWLKEAASKELVLKPAGTIVGPAPVTSGSFLVNIAWLQPGGNPDGKRPAVSASKRNGTRNAADPKEGEVVGFIKNGHWLAFDAVECGRESYDFFLRVASVGKSVIEIRRDHAGGPLLGSAVIPDTGGWDRWTTVKVGVEVLTGANRMALVFKSDAREAKEKMEYKGLHESCLWFGEVKEHDTTIWAQFKGIDPNQHDTEINVRQAVFYPRKPGCDYITVRGFTMAQAATPWAPPTAEQIGLIGTHWSRGWIIEDNTIRHSRCVGITLGKYGDEWDNRSQSATAYNETISRALENGWNRETVGGHLVRNNRVSHCEQAGIVGSLGAVFSTVEGNVFEEIYTQNLFHGAEMGAIKFHGAIDVVIKDNLIRRCGGLGVIWLDWMAQGTRITGNLLYGNLTYPLFVEVNHGPFLFDNNILIGTSVRNWSQGGAYVHNFIPGEVSVNPQTRETPYHRPHSTEVLGLAPVPGGDDRYFNNLMAHPDAFARIREVKNVVIEGNSPVGAVTVIEKEDGIYLSFDYPEVGPTQVVTTARLGKTLVSRAAFENPDGSPLTITTDYFGRPRDPANPGVGPFSGLQPGRQEIKVWPK